MKFRAFGFAIFLFGAAGLIAASNTNCAALQALANDGAAPSDGGLPGDGGPIVGDGGPTAGATVTAAINCQGDACGKMGTIIGRVKACGTGGAVSQSATLPGQTLTMGTPITLTIPNVPIGPACLRTYLDVNGNSMQDTGDVIPATEEVNIDVQAAGAAATVDLTQVKP